MDVADIVATPAVWLLGALLVSSQVRRLPRRLATWIYLGYVGHLAAAIAQVVLTRSYFGGGDMFLYATQGEWLAQAVWQDPGRFFPEVLRLVLQQDAELPFRIIGAGSSTGSMAGIAALLFVITGGSLYASIATVVIGAYLGKLVLFRALREEMRGSGHGLLLACLLLPSTMFWSAGLLKESVAMGPFCFLVALLIQARGWLSWRNVLAVICAIPVALVKAYILMALMVGAAVMFYVKRARRRGEVVIRPLYLAVGAALAAGGMVLLGQLFPEYAVDNLGESLGNLQTVGQRVEGGSNYFFTSGQERSLAGQLAFAPIAIVTALFRPFFFEFHNAASLIAAVEATFITFLAIRAFAKRGWRAMLRQVLNSPVLAFCVVFTLAFGLGVGLGTTNMGTLSRYRMPLMPFWATLLVVWNADLFERKAARRTKRRHGVSPVAVAPRPRIRPRGEADAEA